MLKIEEKLDRESSLKWEDKEAELKEEGEMITIDKFIDFFTEKSVRRKLSVSSEISPPGETSNLRQNSS